VAPAFARAAEGLGARLLCGVELQGLRTEAGGFLAVTSAGAITTRRVVNCAGAEAGAIAAMVGLELPLRGYPIQVSVTEPVAPLVRHLVYSAGRRLTLKQARSGALLIGGGWPAKLDPGTGRLAVDPESLRANLGAAIRTVPALRSAQLLRTWPAIVNGTDDWRPILGEVPRVPGFYFCLIPWLGFSVGPIAARAVAALILGKNPEVDIDGFSPTR
jgi:sarcosine oxidase subunit beta